VPVRSWVWRPFGIRKSPQEQIFAQPAPRSDRTGRVLLGLVAAASGGRWGGVVGHDGPIKETCSPVLVQGCGNWKRNRLAEAQV